MHGERGRDVTDLHILEEATVSDYIEAMLRQEGVIFMEKCPTLIHRYKFLGVK